MFFFRLLLWVAHAPSTPSSGTVLGAGPQEDVFIQTALCIAQGGRDLLITSHLGPWGAKGLPEFQEPKGTSGSHQCQYYTAYQGGKMARTCILAPEKHLENRLGGTYQNILDECNLQPKRYWTNTQLPPCKTLICSPKRQMLNSKCPLWWAVILISTCKSACLMGSCPAVQLAIET